MHRIYNHLRILRTAGNLLKEDALLHIAPRLDGVCDGKRVEEPLPRSVVFQLFGRSDRVFVGVLVADNLHAEEFGNRLAVLVEGAQRQRLAIGQTAPIPQVANLLKG